MGTGRALLVRCAEADDRFAANQRRTCAVRQRLLDGPRDRGAVVPIDAIDYLPAVCLESARGIVGKPPADLAVDRDLIVVIQTDELAEFQRAGERTGFVRYPLHQAAIAEEYPGPVIDDLVARTIERRGKHFLCERHADCVGYALPERPGRGLDRQVAFAFRVARSPVTELAEVPDFVDRQGITGQVQQAVKQHRAVTVRQHESIAVPPLGIPGVML